MNEQLIESVKRILDVNDTMITESSLSRLWKKYQECDSGTISACRGENTPEQNKKRTAKLKAALLGLGYSVTKINGVYIENYGKPNAKKVREVSFIVFDQHQTGGLELTLRTLGKAYRQDSITFNSVKDGSYYLIGTSRKPGLQPAFNQKIKLGKPMWGKSGEFHSTVNGRPFVFSESTSNDYHNFDDTLRNYHSWHGQALQRIGKEFMAIQESELDSLSDSMLEECH